MATAKKNAKNSKSSKGKGEVPLTELIDSASVADEELAQRFKAHEGYVYYFAYDEDVDVDQITQQCPGAVFVDGVSLLHYGFGVGEAGKPTIVRKSNHSLEGILWAVPRAEAEALVEHRGTQGYSAMLVEMSFGLKSLNRRKRNPDYFTIKALVFEVSGLKLMADMGDHAQFELVASLRKDRGLVENESLTEIIQLSGGHAVPTSTEDDYLDYVCSLCFLPLGKCACPRSFRGELVQIDRGIQHAIHVLNLKGYDTKFCCAGHPRGTYIMFCNSECAPEAELPEGLKWNGLALRAEYPYKATREECWELNDQRLEALNAWCDELPINKKTKFWL